MKIEVLRWQDQRGDGKQFLTPVISQAGLKEGAAECLAGICHYDSLTGVPLRNRFSSASVLVRHVEDGAVLPRNVVVEIDRFRQKKKKLDTGGIPG